MEWLLKLLNLFKGSDTRVIISGYKELYETYKKEMIYWKQKAQEVQKMDIEPAEKETEMEFLKKIIELTQKVWDLQEEIIFLKIIKENGKHKNQNNGSNKN